MTLHCCISRVDEVVGAFLWREGGEKVSDAAPRCLLRSFGGFAEQMFELCEDLFDGIEVGAVGRQEHQPRSSGPDCSPDGVILVATDLARRDAPCLSVTANPLDRAAHRDIKACRSRTAEIPSRSTTKTNCLRKSVEIGLAMQCWPPIPANSLNQNIPPKGIPSEPAKRHPALAH